MKQTAKQEKLAASHPAEIHADGIPLFIGDISATVSQGLLLSDARLIRGKQSNRTVNIVIGTRCDLVFKQLQDDDGSALVVPMTIGATKGKTITLVFVEKVSVVTGNVLRQLKGREHTPQKPVTPTESGDLLSKFRKHALNQLDKLVHEFLLSLSDHLFDISVRAHGNEDRNIPH